VATFYFVRHAKAGSRGHWDGDDRVRPLSKKGMQQAEALVSVFAPYPISTIFSSQYLRCLQTVQPLARARGLEIQETPALEEGRGLEGAYAFLRDPALDHTVLCTHGDIVWELVEDLVKQRVLPVFREEFEKGSTWLVDSAGGKPVRARYIPAP
jgi:phosphohistidine phosphatase SixA